MVQTVAGDPIEKYRKERQALRPRTGVGATAIEGYYLNYIQGMAKGRSWNLQPEIEVDNFGRGYICHLLVSGPDLFSMHKGAAGRWFASEPQASEDAAKEAVAQIAYELLDNLTNNEKRGRLPAYDAPPEYGQQGRRASSSSSSDAGSDDTTNTAVSSASTCTCGSSRRSVSRGRCTRCESRRYYG